jgi:hypothetical protein
MADATDALERRKNALDEFLETRVAQGDRVESRTDTQAIIIVGGDRSSFVSRLRRRRVEARQVASVDEHGEVTMRTAEPARY